MKCSLIKMPKTDKKTKDTDATDFAKIAGVKFIELGHHRGMGQHSIRTGGLQGVEIKSIGRGGSKRFEAFPTKDAVTGKPCASMMGLEFVPDVHTNLLRAYCPDTKYNRDILARTCVNGWPYRIMDADIEKELKDLARKKGYYDTKAKTYSSKEIVKKQSTEIEELKAKLAEAEKNLEFKQETDDINNADVESEKKELRAKITADVEAEYKDLVKRLKSNPQVKKLEDSPKYKEVVLSEIDKRYEAALKDL